MILGISPGTNRLGYAVMRKGEIVYWGTRCFRGPWKRKKLKSILHELDRLISRYGVTQVAIKAADQLPRFLGLLQLIGAMNVFLESKCVRVQYYSLDEIKREIAGHSGAIKRDVFELLWKTYPELAARKLANRTITHTYYTKLFEAAAVAHIQSKGKGNSLLN